MSKHARHAPVPIEDFDPFYMKHNLLWVPYYSDGRVHLHTLDPAIAWKGVAFAVRMLGAGQVVPLAFKALKGRGMAD